MCVEEKIQKAGGSNAPKSLLRKKLDYLLKAKEAIGGGNQWIQDPLNNKTGLLERRIEVAEREANK